MAQGHMVICAVQNKILILKHLHCPVSNNSFGSFWFSMVLVGHGFINCLASESFVVSFSLETEDFMEEVLWFLSNRQSAI